MQDSQLTSENTYNTDETGVMLSMLGSVKVLVGSGDTRACGGAAYDRDNASAAPVGISTL